MSDSRPSASLKPSAKGPSETNAPKKARGRPMAEVSAQQLDRLIYVGFRHFIEFGPERTSVQAIADEVGLTRQTIYMRFGSKENFLASVIHDREFKFLASLSFDLETDPRPPQIVLEEYGRTVVEILLEPERVKLARAMYSGLYRYPHLVASERQASRTARTVLTRYLTRCVKARGLDVDCAALTRSFTVQLQGIQLPVLLGTGEVPSPPMRTRRVREIVRTTLIGHGFSLD